MAIQYPESCLATHLNCIVTDPPSFFKTPLQYVMSFLPKTAKEQAGIKRTKWFFEQGLGYYLQQSTRPATSGIAWVDSPIALLSIFWEKLHDWSDDFPWTDDEILTWVSIYQFSVAGPDASASINCEMDHPSRLPDARQWVPNVLIGLSYFPKDLELPPLCYGRTLGPVVFEHYHDEGGHFVAHEKPELLVGDVRKMFGKGGGAYSVTRQFLSSEAR